MEKRTSIPNNETGWGGRTVRNILVVDDNKEAAKALALLLEEDGYTVRSVHDGDAAIEAAGEFSPEVVILDVNLPQKDGYEIAKILKRKYPTMLLIALTGYYGTKEHKTKGRAVGFDHYLTRPILAKEIEKLFSAPV